jgi:pyruvate kinase
MRKYVEAKRLRPHKTCGLMLEVRGRHIRTSEVESTEGVYLKPGTQLFIHCDNPMMPSNNKTIYCNYRDLPRAVRPNDIIYIDDGKIVCLVTECEEV